MPYASTVLAIDPGPIESAYAILHRKDLRVMSFQKADNYTIRSLCRQLSCHDIRIEMIASYGMAVGASVFETCVWVGRFMEVSMDQHERVGRVFRREVKLHLCGNPRAKDANIRQAIIDKYESMHGVGVTKKGGMLYRASKDVWAAIGVGITAIEKERG
jgi:hypothetical protein